MDRSVRGPTPDSDPGSGPPEASSCCTMDSMARGFESKSVEAQQEEAARGRSSPAAVSPEERSSRAAPAHAGTDAHARAADLSRATAPAHKRMLEQAIAALDQQLDDLQRLTRVTRPSPQRYVSCSLHPGGLCLQPRMSSASPQSAICTTAAPPPPVRCSRFSARSTRPPTSSCSAAI